MKVLVVGSGAVGCVLGGSLMRSGQDVTFLARDKNLDALCARGLTIEWPAEQWKFERVHAIGSPQSEEQYDFILFCVKGYDWERAASYLESSSSRFIVTFQNGVSIHQGLQKKFGKRVLGGVIYVAADRIEPGAVMARSLARVVLDGATEVRNHTEQLHNALSNTCVTPKLSENIEVDLWGKYLFLCSFSAINMLTEKPIGPILAEPQTRNLFASLMQEIVQIANARGIPLNSNEIDTILEYSAKLPAAASSSLFADYKRKQNTEVELLQGNLVRMADQEKISAPIARTLYALLKLKTAI